MTNQTKPDISKPHKSRDATRRYRASRQRVDYYPSQSALSAIQQHKHLDNCMAGVIDKLILSGVEAISGK